MGRLLHIILQGIEEKKSMRFNFLHIIDELVHVTVNRAWPCVNYVKLEPII